MPHCWKSHVAAHMVKRFSELMPCILTRIHSDNLFEDFKTLFAENTKEDLYSVQPPYQVKIV